MVTNAESLSVCSNLANVHTRQQYTRRVRRIALTQYMNIQRTEFSVSDFISWNKSGELDLSPYFQRRPVWSKKAKSYFLDTIIKGLPIPIVFVRESTDIESMKTVREVIDGQQRIRTLISYIDPKNLRHFNASQDKFTISSTHNKQYANKPFQKLDENIRKRILSYKITTHILPSDTSDRQVLDIFRRMNATGTKANNQELRNARFHGEFITSVYDISLEFLDVWQKWKLFTDRNIARMQEAEFVSELYILCLNGITEQTKAVIDKFYEEYDVHFPEKSYIENRVTKLLKKIDDDFGDQMQSSIFSNKIWFYPLFAALYDNYYGLGSDLSAKPKSSFEPSIKNKLKKLNDTYYEKGTLPDRVKLLLTGRSNRRENRRELTKLLK